MNVNGIKVAVTTGAGAVGGFIINMLGGWGEDLKTLLIFMAIDFIMGLMLAAFWHKSKKSKSGRLNSNSAWKGLCKKCVCLLFVLVAHRLDVSLGVEYIRTAVIIAFIANELISIVENAGIMGVPLPNVIKKAIDVLQTKSGENTEESK